jgi:hypothetical protein
MKTTTEGTEFTEKKPSVLSVTAVVEKSVTDSTPRPLSS